MANLSIEKHPIILIKSTLFLLVKNMIKPNYIAATVEKEYIKFTPTGLSKSGKTQIWKVTAKDDESDFLGWIKWYGAWRCYGFFPYLPVSAIGELVFEKRCLRDIADFCEGATKDQQGLNQKGRLITPEISP
jgi:hypothetical protein